MSAFAAENVVSRLRLRGVPPDALAAQMRLSAALGAMDLSPSGLPAGAILFIRKLEDPLPGRLPMVRHSHTPPSEWREALGRRIDVLARNAERPAGGVVSNGAEAVYFADRSELLACLGRDWCDSATGSRWWWKSLFRDSDGVRTVLAEWLRSPEYVPAALQQLASTGDAARFVRRVDNASLQTMLERLIERFALANLRVLFMERERSSSNSYCETGPVSASIFWLPLVPEATLPELTVEQASLLGVALLLDRAPNVARSAVTAGAVRRWLKSMTIKSSETHRYDTQPLPSVTSYDSGSVARPASVTTPRKPRDSHQTEAEPGRLSQATADNSDQIDVDLGAGNPPDLAGESSMRSPRGGSDSPVQVTVATPPEIFSASPENRNPAGVTSRVLPKAADASRDAVSHVDREEMRTVTGLALRSTLEREMLDAPWFETNYGGALYLINLALFLELYGDFTHPARPGIELPIWDFVALLGEELIGRDIRRDPVWPLLAELAGRDIDDAPGADFTPASEWRVPEMWIEAFAETGDWQWSVGGRRLNVRHPGGFAVLDIPTHGRHPREMLAEELAPYRASGLCTGIVPRHAPPKPARRGRIARRDRALQRWLDQLLPYVRARLRAALGVGNTVDVGRLVCACRSRLQVTPTHLEAYFALADLPIELRLAGLDRDPGWVPSAGRYVRFHFD